LEVKPSKNTPAAANKTNAVPFGVQKMQDKLMTKFSTKVQIVRTKDGKGEIVIKFYSDDDLDRLMEVIAE
jgi:ParB family chromosome partitioning protein